MATAHRSFGGGGLSCFSYRDSEANRLRPMATDPTASALAPIALVEAVPRAESAFPHGNGASPFPRNARSGVSRCFVFPFSEKGRSIMFTVHFRSDHVAMVLEGATTRQEAFNAAMSIAARVGRKLTLFDGPKFLALLHPTFTTQEVLWFVLGRILDDSPCHGSN